MVEVVYCRRGCLFFVYLCSENYYTNLHSQMIIEHIKGWFESCAIPFIYDDTKGVNVRLQDLDFAAAGGIVGWCYYITNERLDAAGRECAEVAVYFAKLQPFDPSELEIIQGQQALKEKAKEMMEFFRKGNLLTYSGVNFQHQFSLYAENVQTCALRATFTEYVAECHPLEV